MRAEPRLGRIERIKMALRRDWEQTKADLFVGSGRRLEIWWLPTLAECVDADPVLQRLAASWDQAKGKGRK